MPTIEERALALVNEVKAERLHPPIHSSLIDRDNCSFSEAICRAIEALVAERAAHAAFRQEVSDEIERCILSDFTKERLSRFIIPKPVDPLVEVLDTMLRRRTFEPAAEVVADEAAWLRAALAERGLKLVEVGDAD
jgi:hypothetical protein